jgi:hypothetical protein
MKHSREDEIIHCDETTLVTLPDDVIKLIIIADDWYKSGTFMACSKNWLLFMTNDDSLKSMMGQIMKEGRRPFRWLTQSLPSKLLKLPFKPPDRQELDGSILEKIWSEMPPKASGGDYIVTGGHIVKQIYNTTWESDIDIFYEKQRVDGHYANHDMILCINAMTGSPNFGGYDIIVKDMEVYRMIETFDLSIVMMGVVGNDFFITPLALYTYFTKIIIAMPYQPLVEYFVNDTDHYERHSAIPRYIKEHQMDGHTGQFHHCEKCNRDDISLGSRVPLARVWRERVLKYEKRFPEFSIEYIC